MKALWRACCAFQFVQVFIVALVRRVPILGYAAESRPRERLAAGYSMIAIP